MKVRLAALIALSSGASAQIESAFVWVQGNPGSNFATMHADLDTETGSLSVWGDYEGLVGDLQAVEVTDHLGAPIGDLSFTDPREGLAHGTIALDGSALDSALESGIAVNFTTTAFPISEMDGSLAFYRVVSRSLVLSGEQVVGGLGAPGATNALNLALFPDGRVTFSCQLAGLDLPITGLELRGPAWRDEVGPLLLDLQPFDTSQNPSAVFVQIPAGTLTEAQCADVQEGFAYVLVRTQTYPTGAARAQLALDVVENSYCSGRKNSSSAIGGRITLDGSPRLIDGDLRLRGQFFPSGALVLPIVGTASGHSFLPGSSEGILCLDGGPINRLVDRTSTGLGLAEFTVPLDLAQLQVPGGASAGQTLRFQCWYRDSVQGQATSNFSNAVGIRVR